MTGYIKYAVVICMMVLLAGSSVVAEEKEEPAAAIVNGERILMSDLDREMQAAVASNPELRSSENIATLRKMRKDALNYLIKRELIIQEGKKSKLEPQDKEIDAEFAKVKQRFPSQDVFKQVMEQQGLTEKRLRELIKRGLTAKKVIEAKVKPTMTPITDKDISDFYGENKDGFAESEKVSARHILIKVDPDAGDQEKADAKKNIQNILKEARGGADFAELAKKHSQCSSASQGGDLGYFYRGQMVKPFEEVAFALQSGEVSDIVETQFGYHIILVQDKKPNRQLTLEEVKDQIKEALYEERMDIALENWLKPLREKAAINILM